MFCGRLNQLTRGSSMRPTTSSESSVQPSPITSSSKSSNVWPRTLPMENGRTVLQLYVAMRMLTAGMAGAYTLSAAPAVGDLVCVRRQTVVVRVSVVVGLRGQVEQDRFI